MALWQFKIVFIPTDFVGLRTVISEQEWNDETWWQDTQLSFDFKSRFSEMLPPLKSWHEDLLQWGTQESDLIEVWIESEKLDSITCRIDCRNPNFDFIRKVVDVAQRLNCKMVYSRYRNVLPSEYADFVHAVFDSPNRKFLEAPAEWLPKLASEVNANDKEH